MENNDKRLEREPSTFAERLRAKLSSAMDHMALRYPNMMILIRWFMGVSWGERLKSFSYAGKVLRLVHEADISVETILGLDKKTREELYVHAHSVLYLIRNKFIRWEELISLNQNMRSELYECNYDFHRLIEYGFISFQDFWKLPEHIRHELRTHHHSILDLASHGFSFDIFKSLKEEIRRELYAKYDNWYAIPLISCIHHDVSWEKFGHLGQHERNELYRHYPCVTMLTKAGISWDIFIALTDDVRAQLYSRRQELSDRLQDQNYASLIEQGILDPNKLVHELLLSSDDESFFKKISKQVMTCLDDLRCIPPQPPEQEYPPADSNDLSQSVKDFLELKKNATVLTGKQKDSALGRLPDDVLGHILEFTTSYLDEDNTFFASRYALKQSQLAKDNPQNPSLKGRESIAESADERPSDDDQPEERNQLHTL